ncbi:MAG: hypothetical protein E6Q75_11560 [Rheinheimera sp.]|nr:MAG: hypothetical protein E6Q75_11560 [Rheinheimera sp.]
MYHLDLLREDFQNNSEKSQEIIRFLHKRKYYKAIEISNFCEGVVFDLKKSFSDEARLNEAYLLQKYFCLLKYLSIFWNRVELGHYYDSWWSLQDAIDTLRIIKKFYQPDSKTLNFLESNLTALESLYPYTLFSSLGFIVERYECGICNLNITDERCNHIQGEIYSGEMATSIAVELKKIDHLALVENPKDKRLAINIGDENPHFGIFRELIAIFDKNNYGPLDISNVVKSEFKVLDEKWKDIPRNSVCYCGSGVKYKKCCISNKYKKHVHVDFVISSMFC